jgi:hypothetical protein
MFNLFKPKPADVLNHWYSLVPNFDTPTQEFYEDIEEELKMRKVPGLEISRVQFAEGGLLSGKREYLRMSRERLVFDICAAPFGTSYFFSCRFAEILAIIKIWQLILLFIALIFIVHLAWKVAGFQLGSLLLIILFGGGIYALRNAVVMGFHDLDAQIIKSPVIGPLYERFLRKETYYRHDTRLMYLEIVNSVAKTMVEDITAEKGVKLVQFNEHSPILRELYKPKVVSLPRSEEAQVA